MTHWGRLGHRLPDAIRRSRPCGTSTKPASSRRPSWHGCSSIPICRTTGRSCATTDDPGWARLRSFWPRCRTIGPYPWRMRLRVRLAAVIALIVMAVQCPPAERLRPEPGGGLRPEVGRSATPTLNIVPRRRKRVSRTPVIRSSIFSTCRGSTSMRGERLDRIVLNKVVTRSSARPSWPGTAISSSRSPITRTRYRRCCPTQPPASRWSRAPRPLLVPRPRHAGSPGFLVRAHALCQRDRGLVGGRRASDRGTGTT